MRVSLSRAIAIAGISVCWLCVASLGQVHGQSIGSFPRGSTSPYNPKPTVSPYINLLQNNGNGGLPTYQSLVRPLVDQENFQQQTLNTNRRMQSQVNSLQSQVGKGGAAAGRATGHPTRYMNYSHYYNMPR